MPLTHEQKRFMHEHGYLHLPGAVPQELVRAARRAINHSIGQNGIDPAQLNIYRAQSYTRELQKTPVIADLMNKSGLFELIESLLAREKVHSVTGGQIALRFPSLAEKIGPPGAHIDGVPTPTNGVPADQLRPFTMLAGVYLSDVIEPDSGNFTVWPGTHRLFGEHFKTRDPYELMNGMPKVEMPPAKQLTGRAGDAFLAHFMTGHSAAGNISPDTRYAIFFRISHVNMKEGDKEIYSNIWRDWEGMRDVLAQAETVQI